MQVKHLFSEHIYLVNNHAVALNPIFINNYYRNRFLEKMEKYLAPICDVLAYSFQDNQFQLLVRLKGRSIFEDYYRNKQNYAEITKASIPETSYIFSQIMANLQASTAIHFNRREGRSGALFARRYDKLLVKSKVELETWVSRLNSELKIHEYNARWRSKFSSGKRKMGEKSYLGSSWIYYRNGRGVNKGGKLSNFITYQQLDLQGQFNNLPPKAFPFHYTLSKAFKIRFLSKNSNQIPLF